LIADYYAKHVGATIVRGEVAECHPDFMKDLLVKVIEVVKNDEENICPSKRIHASIMSMRRSMNEGVSCWGLRFTHDSELLGAQDQVGE
jgi:hypothetical protein